MPRNSKLLRWLVLVPPSLQVIACTLTSDSFTPTRIDALTPDAAPAAAPPSPMAPPPSNTEMVDSADAGSGACTSTRELPGCTLLQEAPPECVADGDCASLHCQDGVCVAASCDDGIANQGESGPDCAGPCTARCADGDACTSTADCESGLFCPEQRRQCTQISCADGARNGDEVGTDCGGSCAACPIGTACGANVDCATGVCSAGSCAAPSCNDGILNQNESAADCGGGCPDCSPGLACRAGADCDSGVCEGRGCAAGLARCCQPPRCNDDVRNGTEPQVDCGNAQCGACALGSPCNRNAECATGLCQNGSCRQQPCQDGQRNGLETDTDCGGTSGCARCGLGDTCLVNQDCGAGSCVNGRCANCANGVRDGNETGSDCGGVCGPCGPGQGCDLDTECQSGVCQDDRCCGGNQGDCTRCARQLAPGISCASDGDAVETTCTAFLQCLEDNAAECPNRTAAGCADAGGVCDVQNFGGNGSAGIVLADRIIGTAQCVF